MAWLRSQLLIIEERPWRWTTPPNPDGTGGVKSAPLDGVFILLSDELVQRLKTGLSQAQKDELQTWVDLRTEAHCATWHVPLWAGETSGYFLRVPAAVWNDPSSEPPAKVKTYLQHLWQETQQ
jgi:hypothetical protein